MKHGWLMYVFLLILAVILVRNAAGTVGVLLGGSSAGTGVITALQGPTTGGASKGSFNLGTGRSITLA